MELAVIANFLLFFGALGVNLVLDSRSTDDDSPAPEPLYNPNAYSRADTGTEGDDSLTADRDNLAFFLGGGDDDLTGSAGADYASLGTGDDSATMGPGHDIAFGGEGDDTLAGGTGADTLLGGAGRDALSGLNDTAGGGGPDGQDQLFGGDGDDHLLLGRGDAAEGGAGTDRFQLDTRWPDTRWPDTRGSDTGFFRVTDYNDTEDRIEITYTPRFSAETSLEVPPTLAIETTADGASALIRLNGSIIGQIDGAAGLDASRIILAPDTETDPNYLPADYTGEVTGTDAADSFTGTTDPTAWFLQGGNDSLTGSTGDDYARLGDGDDSASLGAGDDIIHAGTGSDSVAGGDGHDTVLAGDGRDTIFGGAGDDMLAGEAGADLITGSAGADSLVGGAGDDTLSGYTATGAADATLVSIDGIDTLSGGIGNDTLIIGHGDQATGGAGADTFGLDHRWGEGSEVALITDYVRGTDVLHLLYTPVFNNSGIEIPPVVTIVMGPANAYAIIRIDGDPVAHLTGATTLQASDIILQRAVA